MSTGLPPEDMLRSLSAQICKTLQIESQIDYSSKVEPIGSVTLHNLHKTTPIKNLHPSQIKFNDESQQLEEFLDFVTSKKCTMEDGRTCDRCDICSTLGF